MDNKLGSFIKEWRKERNMGLRDLAKLTGISHAYLHVLEGGVDPRTKRPVSPTLQSLQKLATGLDVPLEVVISLGLNQDISLQLPGRINRPGGGDWEVQEEPGLRYSTIPVDQDNFLLAPILGQITGGKEDISEGNIEQWWPVDISIIKIHGRDFNSYFYLRIQERSMEPVLNEGDLALIKKGVVKDGDIAVVIGDNTEIWIKKIQYLSVRDQIMLISRNPDYPPLVRSTAECTIIGRVVFRLGEPKW
jgi:SOS-response transcriptional repressor LexA